MQHHPGPPQPHHRHLPPHLRLRVKPLLQPDGVQSEFFRHRMLGRRWGLRGGGCLLAFRCNDFGFCSDQRCD